MSDTDTCFVDLIQEQPAPRDKFMVHSYFAEELIDQEYAEYLDSFQPFRIVIAAHNGEPLFRSTERYKAEVDARRAIDIAFGPNTNVWLRQEGKEQVAVRVAWRD